MRFLVLAKFISPSNEVTWKPERLFHGLEEAKEYIRKQTRSIPGLPSWDFDIKKLTKRERRKYRGQEDLHNTRASS